MLNQAEAKTKWCPLSRMDNGSYAGFNRWGGANSYKHPSNSCMGADCMAWRWEDKPDTGASRRGFCGAFGKPVYPMGGA